MYFDDSQSQQIQHYYDEEQEDEVSNSAVSPPSPTACSQGHRSTLILQTKQGGSICLLCFSNLISNPQSPTVHVSYALSQLSQAISDPPFLRSLLTFHSHFLVSPLVHALSSFDDDPIARQVVRLVSALCDLADASLSADFVARVSDRLSSGSLAWSRRQVYTLHCLGVLLNCQQTNPYAHIRDKYGLITNLVAGLQLPSEEIRGEILFVLYKVSVLQYASEDGDGTDILFAFCPKLLHLSLEALMKTQSDDVRLNCVALLTVLTQRGLFGTAYALDSNSMTSSEGDSFEQVTEEGKDVNPMNVLFTEAIKGPLLSTDSQVQISTLDLLFHYMSWEGTSGKELQALLEENIADYVFEILRLSECKDPLVKSCVQVLDILSKAEQAFKQRLVVGFATLVPVLNYVADVPFHPAQSQTLKLIWNCISDCPGMVSSSHIAELVPTLTKMLKKHSDGEMGMVEETFILTCSVLVSIIRTPSAHANLNLQTSIEEAMQHAVFSCLSTSEKHTCQLLHSLFLLKEAYYMYSQEGNSTKSAKVEIRQFVMNVCTKHLLPWFVTNFNEMDEDTVLGVLETIHLILLQDSDNQAAELANSLVSSTWFSLSFGCLGLFPTEKMKQRVYIMHSSLVDVLMGNDAGQPIRDAALCLPSDPIDLLFLLGQKNSRNLELSSCHSAILLILYTSSLYDERLADDKLVLASLEQYILVNSSDLQGRATDPIIVMRLVYLYGLYRGLAKVNYQIPYSPEAERILFETLSETEWDLPSARIHPISLKWLFQEEKISRSLSYQLLKFCGRNVANDSGIIVHGNNSRMVNVNSIAELIAGGDNRAAILLVSLLIQLLEKGHEHDIISVLNLMTASIDIFPTVSDQLCLHGIGNALQNLFCESNHTQSPQISKAALVLIFKTLCSVHHGTLSDEESWLAVTMKLINIVTPRAPDAWNHECLLVMGILSLVLHHSSNEVLLAPSKAIVLSTSLVSAINSVIHAACLKGPALADHDEETSSGEVLIFVLLLNYFSLRSLHTVLPGIVDWKHFFDPPDRVQPISFIGMYCHDLCRLLHFGSGSVKLVASYCLLDLFNRLSDQQNRTGKEIICTTKHQMSITAVLEGLIFYTDLRVAMNCGLCLSMILRWESAGMQGTSASTKNNWSRMIVEELAMSLAVPSLASKSFINLHKPAIYVAVTLLRRKKVPEWMRSVFDDSCISAVIQNIEAPNLSAEIVLLFRALLNSEFLKTEQIAIVNQLLQVCRKQKYSGNSRGESGEEGKKKAKAATVLDDMGEVCEFLIDLMASESTLDRDPGGLQVGDKRLLEEIELFFKTQTETNGS
ncbi:hypothetical protein ACFX11_031935 [Malus domestica]